jgi:hypothetical protein
MTESADKTPKAQSSSFQRKKSRRGKVFEGLRREDSEGRVAREAEADGARLQAA